MAAVAPPCCAPCAAHARRRRSSSGRRRAQCVAPPRSLPPPPSAASPPTPVVRVLALDVEFDHYACPNPPRPPGKPVGKAARRAASARNKHPPPLTTTLRIPAALALVEPGGGEPVLWAGIDPPAEVVATPGVAKLGRTGRGRGRPPPPLQLPSAAAAVAALLAALAGPPPATVLVGHGLSGDLAALGLKSGLKSGVGGGAVPPPGCPPGLACVDTLPLTDGRSLASAAAEFLGRPIQTRGRGSHCPAEDAHAALGVWLVVGSGEACETVRLMQGVRRQRGGGG